MTTYTTRLISWAFPLGLTLAFRVSCFSQQYLDLEHTVRLKQKISRKLWAIFRENSERCSEHKPPVLLKGSSDVLGSDI